MTCQKCCNSENDKLPTLLSRVTTWREHGKDFAKSSRLPVCFLLTSKHARFCGESLTAERRLVFGGGKRPCGVGFHVAHHKYHYIMDLEGIRLLSKK